VAAAGFPVQAADMALAPSGADLQQRLAQAKPGDIIRVPAGRYTGVTAVTVPHVTLIGAGWPVLDGGGKGSVLIVRADGVTVRGFRITNTGRSNPGDDAGIRLVNAHGCTIAGNVMDHVYFGVMAKRSSRNRITGNRLDGEASRGDFNGWGDGVRLWDAPDNEVRDNVISGFRDGISIDFAHRTALLGNRVRGCVRYGLMSLWSHETTYRQNTFDGNDTGTIIAFARRPQIEANTFSATRGRLGYGIAFKGNTDGVLRRNRILDNTLGLFFDDASRNRVDANTVAGNGWALLLYANSVDNAFSGNAFVGNDYDMAMDMRNTRNRLDGNYWSAYRGYDMDGDGIGDQPHAPVGMLGLLAMQYPDLSLFALSPAVSALAFAQRLLPALAPSTLRDAKPLVAPSRPDAG
jgi:nitrous oxidase accessory protein